MKNNSKFASSFLIGFYTSINEIMSHKLRSFLSLIGVMLGVGCLVAMFSIVEGTKNYMKNVLVEVGGLDRISLVRQTPELIDEVMFSRSRGLRFSDLDSLVHAKIGAENSSKFDYRGSSFSFMGIDFRCILWGVNKFNILEDRKIYIDEGRIFTTGETESFSNVCIIGDELAEIIREKLKLNPMFDGEIIGKEIRFKEGFVGRIIGVYSKKIMKRRHYRRGVMFPIKTFEKEISGFNVDQGRITLKIKNINKIAEIKNQINKKVIGLHRGVKDYIFKQNSWIEEFLTMINNFNLVFAIIAFISLTVGGLGIMNVMLSSISERIKEIGVRKALGASATQIFFQFIIESLVLSVLGGAIGLIIGILPVLFANEIESAMDGVRPSLNSSIMILALLVSAAEGLLFGLYPALKASRMNPIKALHYE